MLLGQIALTQPGGVLGHCSVEKQMIVPTTSGSWLRECQECAKLSSRQRVGYYMIPCVLMSSLLFYNVENSANKGKPLNE